MIEKAKRNLRCMLTDAEMLQYGQEAAKETACAQEAEERKSEVDKQMKAEIESHSNRALSLSRKINNGYEFRDVECEIHRNFKTKTVKVVRLDTNEMVDSRPMTNDELQGSMNLEEQE